MDEFEVFELGDCTLQSGEQLPAANLAYTTYGTLNAARDNVILFPTHYGGTHKDNLYLIRERSRARPAPVFHRRTRLALRRRFVVSEQYARS